MVGRTRKLTGASLRVLLECSQSRVAVVVVCHTVRNTQNSCFCASLEVVVASTVLCHHKDMIMHPAKNESVNSVSMCLPMISLPAACFSAGSQQWQPMFVRPLSGKRHLTYLRSKAKGNFLALSIPCQSMISDGLGSISIHARHAAHTHNVIFFEFGTAP